MPGARGIASRMGRFPLGAFPSGHGHESRSVSARQEIRGSVAERSELNSDCESTFIDDGGNIAGTMQDANDDDFVGPWKVVDRVLLTEDNAQIR
jgi:hypothetical protein